MSLVTRAMNMLKTPKTEWDVVAGEAASIGGLYTGYAIPWSLLQHLASFIGSAFLAGAMTSVLGFHLGMTYWLGSTVLSWVLSLVGIYVAAFIVNALAGSFGSTKSGINAFKLVVYGYTGTWVGGLFAVIPILGGLVAIAGAVYSVYLFYLGLPKMMGTPKEKVVGYMLVSALIMIVIYVLIGLVVGAISMALFVTGATTMIHSY